MILKRLVAVGAVGFAPLTVELAPDVGIDPLGGGGDREGALATRGPSLGFATGLLGLVGSFEVVPIESSSRVVGFFQLPVELVPGLDFVVLRVGGGGEGALATRGPSLAFGTDIGDSIGSLGFATIETPSAAVGFIPSTAGLVPAVGFDVLGAGGGGEGALATRGPLLGFATGIGGSAGSLGFATIETPSAAVGFIPSTAGLVPAVGFDALGAGGGGEGALATRG
ncbi:MAG: hypothetical protein JNM99_20550, partial [Verrucomicrobiaceae bacterium]|nr:hypothetical protein [Verrucomicrobiaceae bacterium]